MKRVIIYLQGLGWRRMADAQERSLLMVCRAPRLRALARVGRAGLVTLETSERLRQHGLLPAALCGVPAEILSEVRRGGLEAAGFSGLPEDRFWYRADFSARDDEAIRGPTVRGLSETETRVLAEALSDLWRAREIAALVAAPGHLLLGLPITGSAMAAGVPPWHRTEEALMGPQGGTSQEALLELEAEIGERLQHHDINLVRVDLGENPANGLCLWGGSRSPDPLPLQSLRGSTGAVWAPGSWGRGLAGWLGLAPVSAVSLDAARNLAEAFSPARISEALRDHDTLLVPVEAPELLAGAAESPAECAAYLERCDRFVLAPLLDILDAHRPWRLLLATDAPPFVGGDGEATQTALALLAGERVVPDSLDAWNEETCLQGGMGSITLDSLLESFWES